jgi:hypothetical protein
MDESGEFTMLVTGMENIVTTPHTAPVSGRKKKRRGYRQPNQYQQQQEQNQFSRRHSFDELNYSFNLNCLNNNNNDTFDSSYFQEDAATVHSDDGRFYHNDRMAYPSTVEGRNNMTVDNHNTFSPVSHTPPKRRKSADFLYSSTPLTSFLDDEGNAGDDGRRITGIGGDASTTNTMQQTQQNLLQQQHQSMSRGKTISALQQQQQRIMMSTAINQPQTHHRSCSSEPASPAGWAMQRKQQQQQQQQQQHHQQDHHYPQFIKQKRSSASTVDTTSTAASTISSTMSCFTAGASVDGSMNLMHNNHLSDDIMEPLW